MDFLATPNRRTALFAALYFSEGAPIGFLWLALPTQLRSEKVPITQITWLTAVLVLPWTLKFLWAPLVDLLRSPRFTLKHWILAAQAVMGGMLLPLWLVDLRTHFALVAGCLVVHAFAAATQDVAIDALCISVTNVQERGHLNGWMQTGMLLGRASMGGGALILAGYLGNEVVVGLLIGCVTFSMGMVAMIPSRSLHDEIQKPIGERARVIIHNVKLALSNRQTWKGLLFAVLGGAAFKSLEVVIGPYLIDRQFTKTEVGYMTAGPMIGSMVIGALAGGRMADVFRRRTLVAGALAFIAVSIAGLAGWDLVTQGQPGNAVIGFLCVIAFGIGWFTAASYALFMDLTTPLIAATQFSAFMGATNACESWSVYTIGRLIDAWGYPEAFLCLCAASLLALPILLSLDQSADDWETAQSAGEHAPQ